ncbi:hypothetical protein NOR53_1621 [gamma proteobacterium NOR5-3]|nr:hypothetical protein NOR53_1621 [gamma proteobacterium NOR5-3]
MSDSNPQRFNLVFSGQLLPGTDTERAKRTLAAFFGLRDTSGVAIFFSGKPVPLRRNITRSDAQRLYQQLRSVGLICELESANTPKPEPLPEPKPKPKPKPRPEPEAEPKPEPPPTPPPTPQVTPPQPTQQTGPAATIKPAIPAQTTSRAAVRGQTPNLFALRPAFSSLEPSQLREAAQIRSFIAAGAALALCAVVLAVVLRFPAAPAGQEPVGALAGTTLPGDELVLLVEGAILLHERSGLPRSRVSASELGFSRLAPPLWAMKNGELLFNAATEEDALRLQRCNLQELRCYNFSPQAFASPVVAIAASLLGDSIFLLSEAGQLWRSNSAGEIESTATVQLPWGQPRILPSGGLLLIPAGDAPMLGVYRPDQQSFGQQLDALLVMPSAAIAAGQDRLLDVAQTGENYWALMAGNNAAPGLYQLDRQWGNPLGVALGEQLLAPYFIAWRDKLLVADSMQMLIQRVASDGRLEAPFESSLLKQERDDWIKTSQQRSLMRQLGIGLPLIVILLCIAAALLYLASYRALCDLPQKRSALLDPLPAGIHWLPQSAHKDRAIARLGMVLLLTSAVALTVLGSLGGWRQAAAALPMLMASLYAWSELARGSGGHLGLLDQHFICVDYDGRYFYGERSLLRGSAAIALAPEVVLPISLPGLPNLDTTNLARERYTTRQSTGPVEILGAMWLCHHPWINAALATVAGVMLTISLLLIIG